MLCHISAVAWVNYEFIKARRSQTIWLMAPIFKLSVFGKRVTQSGLCTSTETRECGGWVNFDKRPEWKRTGPHRILNLVSHLISVRIWVNIEFIKGRRSKAVRCLFLIAKLPVFGQKVPQSVLCLGTETQLR